VLGMGVRLLSAGVVLAAILLARDRLPPLPTLSGYLLVLMPLLFMEIRFLK
jgi:hypothetical protein